jgi:smad nuclear-interacting protein 1
MRRSSRSPPLHREYNGSRTGRHSYASRDRDRDDGRSTYHEGGSSRGGGRGRSRHERDNGSDHPRRDYNGRDGDRDRPRHLDRSRSRDRERGRDRDRERDRDQDRPPRGGARRSASPRSRPRSTRPSLHSGSNSRRSRSPVDKTKPNFAPSGLLAAATNTATAADGKTTVLKYNEPPEARKPSLGWRLYVFKGDEQLGQQRANCTPMTCADRLPPYSELLHIHRQSAYLIGRDRLVADIAIDHPSCSKQHAVIQCTH